jgi:polo-like kinase 1
MSNFVTAGKRPSLEEILMHPWFISGPFPTELTSVSLGGAPTFPAMSPDQIVHNFRKLKRRCAAGKELPLSKNVPEQPPKSVPGVVASPVQARQAVNQAIARQEEEFKRAVAPDSPISTLLSWVHLLFAGTDTN